jgi:hypothetical protein
MKKRVIIFLATVLMIGAQPAMHAQSWWSTITSWFTEKPAIALATTTAVVGSMYAFKQWYWSPEKVKQRRAAELEKCRKIAYRLWPSKIKTLSDCFTQAMEQYSSTVESIGRVKEELGDIDSMQQFDLSQAELTLERRSLGKLKRLKRELIGSLQVAYEIAQEIAEQSCKVAHTFHLNGLITDIYNVTIDKFLSDSTTVAQVEEAVNELVQNWEKLSDREIQIADGSVISGEQMFNERLAAKVQKLGESDVIFDWLFGRNK